MRKLVLVPLVALEALLLPGAVLAQPYIQPSGQGPVGPYVTATDPSGNSRKVVLPGMTLYDGTGTASGTAANPTIVAGPETNGSPVAGGGVRVMGSDGTNARDIVTDGNGYVQAQMIGLSPGGSQSKLVAIKLDGTSTPTAASTWGIVVGGFDGTTARPLKQDANGYTLDGRLNPGTSVTSSSGNVANTNAVATLAGAASKTTWINGFQCSAAGATSAAVVNLTVAGVITGTMTYTFVFPAGVTTAATPVVVNFASPIPASATNTSIVVTLPAGGTGNTNASCSAQGFQL